jgi:hypothetical protein
MLKLFVIDSDPGLLRATHGRRNIKEMDPRSLEVHKSYISAESRNFAISEAV